MFDYDAWLESPYTNEPEGHEHECSDCEGQGKLWIEETQRFSETEVCPKCEDGIVVCWDTDCFEPDDYEPEDY